MITLEEKMIGNPVEIKLTSDEIKSLFNFMNSHIHEDCDYHNFKITSVAGPIASCITVSCDHCGESENITDYGSW